MATSVPEFMVPSPSRPRFSQSDLDSLCGNMDDMSKGSESRQSSKMTLIEFGSDEYDDLQLIAIKRDREFPNQDAISIVVEKRRLGPKVEVGLTQRELDKLGLADDSEGPQGERNPEDSFDINARDDKLLYLKRSRAFGEESRIADGATSDERSGSLLQDELDAICNDIAAAEDCEEEDEDSAYVKKKRERTYLEKPHVAPHSGLALGFSQRQLDFLTGFDEADQSNVLEIPSSPHGTALAAVKRARLYKTDKVESITLEPTALASKMCQADLDAICVDAGDECDAQPSPHGKALLTIKRSRFYDNQPLLAAADIRLGSTPMLEPLMPAPKMGQADLDALCVESDDDDDVEEGPGSPGLLAKKIEMEEEERTWSPWNSPRRSNASSPRGEHGRSPSPVHGGA